MFIKVACVVTKDLRFEDKDKDMDLWFDSEDKDKNLNLQIEDKDVAR